MNCGSEPWCWNLRSSQECLAQKEETLRSIDWGDTVDEDQHVAGLDDSAVRIIGGFPRRFHPPDFVHRDERPLHLLNAPEDVLQIQVCSLAAVIDGLFFDGHVA